MTRKRKMTEDDRKVFTEVFKDLRCRWVYEALGVRSKPNPQWEERTND